MEFTQNELQSLLEKLYKYFKEGLTIQEAVLLHFKNKKMADDFIFEFQDILEFFREIALIEKKYELSLKIEEISENKSNLQGLLFKYSNIDKEYYNMLQEKKKQLQQNMQEKKELKELFYEIRNTEKE